MMRISAYVAFSFLASRKAAAARFSSSGLGFEESFGAANRRVAKAAAVLDCMKARLESQLAGMGIPFRTTEYTHGARPRGFVTGCTKNLSGRICSMLQGIALLAGTLMLPVKVLGRD